jgi:16S rRNA (cytosine967-C5)-methyltransferase
MISPARSAAFDILMLVEKGGYAADLLFTHCGGLDSRDAGLASEVVLGALRYRAQLDFLIERFSGRPAEGQSPQVLNALRMGIYQLRYLERVPSHAAVGESVELVKRAHKAGAAGFVNAVLRKVTRAPMRWPDRATELSHPEGLLRSWERQFGREAAHQIARTNLIPPETYVRVPAGAEIPDGVELEPAGVPGGFRLVKGHARGFRIQDIGSQSVVPLLDLAAGQWLLDVCAAPGNKTAQALESGVNAVACELHPFRARGLRNLGCPVVAADASLSLPFSRKFDRILVDAPCSGTGTLARNPEIKWRLDRPKLAELHALQTKILKNSLQQLAPGGRLVYSTCSLEREENESVVEEVIARATDVRVDRIWRRLPGVEPGDGFFAAVLTSE